jgi:signal transduction histidine kinase
VPPAARRPQVSVAAGRRAAARRGRRGVPLPRPTLRLRLTLLYGGLLVVVCGGLLIACLVLLDEAVRHLPAFAPGTTVTVRTADGQLGTVDSTELQRAGRDSARHRMLTVGLAVFGVATAAGLGAAWVLAGQALTPITRMTATARRLSEQTLDERIALPGPTDEVTELADTFDAMLDRLRSAFDSQRRFVANASHELRTPLAVMRTEVDVALSDPQAGTAELRRMGEVVRGATERADRLVGALLVLASTEAQAQQGLAVREGVDLAELVLRCLAAVRPDAERRCLAVEVQAAPAPVLGDPALLERMVGNLAENAVRHNIDAGWLRVRCGQRDGRCWLEVSNSGPHIDRAEADELFAAFRRGGQARTAGHGAGLGLSIVRAVAVAHGGGVEARPLPDGGLAVYAALPAGPPPARGGQ